MLRNALNFAYKDVHAGVHLEHVQLTGPWEIWMEL